MATASKRLTRKEIRQPDKFITLTENVYDFLVEHRAKALLAGAIVAAALLAFLGWQVYSHRQDMLARQEFNRAITFYRSGNYQDAIAAFQKVEAYSWSGLYPVALLYELNSHLALKDADNAIQAGRRLFSGRIKDPLVRQSALVALAAAEEQKGQCREAVQHYAEAEKIFHSGNRNVPGPLKDKATLGKARCSAQLGDLKGAIAAYREYLRQPDRELTAYVSAQIAELEAKASAPLPAK